MTLSTLSDVINLTANQLKTAHLATFGSENWAIHELLGELYDQMSEYYDDVAEMTRHHGEVLHNTNNSVSILETPPPDLPPCKGTEATEYCVGPVEDLLIAIQETADEYSGDLGVQNKMGDLYEKVDKLVHFKLKEGGSNDTTGTTNPVNTENTETANDQLSLV